ncbi:hypothetical protein CYPRO_2574 [Cyclonatronum proteinivorum]|uniref:Uncharacterized protein n=1 Tax=Cyclonatronum proteinivorum TaxID=1457365 RepID=A0A345UMW4_9BACT|nr:hypothetical protein [Cyclonatronum proteinivorum]AXJ01816.1 hypothetical protein CYPRO_2574 [Cyclonatronum proteinivorum]
MKTSFLIIVPGTLGVMLFLPWWTLIFPCFIAGLVGPDRGIKALSAGMTGVGVLWLVLALMADWQNGFIMSAQVAAVMSVPVWVMYVITWAVGALTGGFACLSGYLIMKRGQ